jgi:hypothetical protein
MKKVEVNKTVFECEVCKKHFDNKLDVKECEKLHKQDKVFSSIFKKAESLPHFETLVKSMIGNITATITNLKFYTYSPELNLISATVTFTSTDKFKKSRWFLTRLFRDSKVPFRCSSGGGSEKEVVYSCYIELKKFPKIYPKFIKLLKLIKEDKESSHLSLNRYKKIKNSVKESLTTNEEYCKLISEEELLTKEYYAKLNEIRDKQHAICNNLENKLGETIPEIKTVPFEDIQKEKEKIFGDMPFNC